MSSFSPSNSFDGAKSRFGRYLPMPNAVDKSTERPNDKAMTDITRPELDARFKENDAKIAASEAKIDARLANFDTSIKTGFAELATAMAKQSAAVEKQTDALRVEMAKQSGDVRSEMAAIRAEMHKGTAELLKWGATIAFTAVAATVGLLTYINKVSEKSPVQPAPQSTAPAHTNAPVESSTAASDHPAQAARTTKP